jgi:geranyl-CoA carboxylase alpha subunit
VASEADRLALHAQLADAVVEIGPAAAAESYLVQERILEAARQTDCDAVHPGYGFLAENASFAAACAEAGLTFLGPAPEVIEEMGLKTRARARMESAGVPVVPGATLPAEADAAAWSAAAERVGYPLLVKAAAGGGGKGMRAVHGPADLEGAVAAARREAQASFGDGRVYLERLLRRPRHIEVQILGDTHGRVLHLGERECSIQRRHQKIVEESPAPALEPALRDGIHRAAVAAAEAVGYVGAGTVEMLLDEDGRYYFLEMNTRLQVEHPVTELVTGVDLVAEQIRVGEGRPLRLRQEDVMLRGHAVEARLYAEDPAEGFLPQTGRVLLFEPPGGPGVRVDTGITEGAEISLHYDPMIAKISAWADGRDGARRRLVEALRETVLLGVGHNLAYLKAILEHPAFAAGRTHTGFLDEHLAAWGPAPLDAADAAQEEEALLAVAAVVFRAGSGRGGPTGAGGPSLWSSLGPVRPAGGG